MTSCSHEGTSSDTKRIAHGDGYNVQSSDYLFSPHGLKSPKKGTLPTLKIETPRKGISGFKTLLSKLKVDGCNPSSREGSHPVNVDLEDHRQIFLNNPQSLLARDPGELSRILSISKKDVNNIRNQGAEAIIMDTTVGHGEESCRILRELDLISSTEKIEEGEETTISSTSAIRPSLSMIGGSTLLDLCSLSSLSPLELSDSVITTGSSALDSLLSPLELSSSTNIKKRSRSEISGIIPEPHSPIGLQSGIVTEVSGPSGSGKTQLSLSLAANAIIHPTASTWKVHYLVAGGGSTSIYSLARRFRQICHSRFHADGERNLPSSDEVLKRISFTVVPDAYYLLATLTELEREFHATKIINKTSYNHLIILDSASGCLSSYLYGDRDGGVGAALLNEVCLSLRRLARIVRVGADTNGLARRIRRQAAVFVTNGVVSAFRKGATREKKPALGELWRTADVQIVLSTLGDVYNNSSDVPGMWKSAMRRVSARLERHNEKQCNASSEKHIRNVQFGIDQSGIVNES